MAHLSEHGIRLSSMSPSFLNSNSTSHTWPFSAVAELIDNASDPGVTAKQIWIDVIEEQGHLCLTFTDNGSGMTPNKLHKMLSFGFTEKGSGKAGHMAIGVYGNGFKSGSMRLGRDALIFTKNGGCQSMGMLSQTYLQNIKAQAVIVPIVPFNQQTNSLVVTEDSEASLEAILRHSLLSSLEQLHAHFDSIPTKKGTKILIWNIRRTRDGNPELDFETDVHDIRMPEIQIEELKKGRRSSGPQRAEQNIPDMDYSLRAYLSILYLKPRTQIVLRGKKVLTKLVAKSLSHIENDVYKPHFSKETVKVTFGLNLKNKDHHGIMMYHKNRLIKSYEKVGGQIKTSGQRAGVGVIGVVECNFLKPAHNKQDFEYTKEYRLTLGALGLKLNDYWRAMVEKKAREREFQALERMTEEESEEEKEESPRWLQCEECLKWRSVPHGHYTVTPEHWNCSQNPNPRFRNCSSPEEAEESEEELTPSYQKKQRKQEQAKSRKREKSSEDKQTSASVPISPSSLPSPQASHTPDPALTKDTHTPDPALTKDTHTPDPALTKDTHTPDPALTKDTHTPDPALTKGTLTQDHQTHTDDLSVNQNDSKSENDVHTHDTLMLEITHTQERYTERDMPTQDQVHTKQEKRTRGQKNTEDVPRTDDAERGKEREVNKDTVESNKRKTVWLPSGLEKRSRLRDQQPVSEDTTEELHLGKDGSEPQLLLGEKSKPDSTTRVERPVATAQHGSSLARTHLLPSTQTVVVSPLSRTEGAWSRPLPPEGGDREAMVHRLAGLEREVQRLRKLLGLEVITATQGTMTTTNPSTEKATDGVETPTGSMATKSGSSQAEWESSSSPSVQGQAAGPCGEAAQGQRAVSGQKELAEQARTRAQSRLRQRDIGASLPSDGSMVQENLRCIRGNVVALLAAILPHLDLAGISLEGNDVDSILQQIIDANSLAL